MTKYTTKGLEARRDAELRGKPIILKTFKVYDGEIEDFENAAVEDLPSFWIEKPITYYMSVGQTGLQFDCRVSQEEATKEGRYFALYLDNGDCYLISKAPGVFGTNIEQRFRIKRDFINNNSATYDCTFIDKIQVNWEDVLEKPSFYNKTEINKMFFNKSITTKIITEDYIANANEDLLIDTTGNMINITLPTPANDLKVWFTDLESNFATNKLVVIRNGATIMNIDKNMDVEKKNISFLLHCIEIAENTFDWRIR